YHSARCMTRHLAIIRRSNPWYNASLEFDACEEYVMDPKWLDWARKLQAIAQTGLSYPKDPFDVERYKAIYEIATEMMATQGNVDIGDVRALFTGEVGHATP